MNFLAKIENAINFLLIKLTELILKFVPASVKNFYSKMTSLPESFIRLLKNIPQKLPVWKTFFMEKVLGLVSLQDIREGIKNSYQRAREQYESQKAARGNNFISKLKMPYLMMAALLQGLSFNQSATLMTLTFASILAAVQITHTGMKLLAPETDVDRTPASSEENLYDRPEYYKETKRQVTFTSYRLHVYAGGVNDLKTVDIDFTVTVNNRFGRMFLDKREFQLRDHLIHGIEPIEASFPLEIEGKEILRQKLILELNGYLKKHKVEAEVQDVQITYILVN